MKGQTAMEYLMTYGWAIVVIVIVIGVLAYMFTQGQKFEYCNFSPVGTLNCEGNPVVYVKTSDPSGTGPAEMIINVRNSYQNPITVLEILCLNSKVQSYTASFDDISDETIQPGSVKEFRTNCKIPGETNTNAIGTVRQKFSGQFVVKYRLDGDPSSIKRTAYATVETTVAQSS